MSIDDFKVAYELMEIIMQSEEWKKIRKNDVRIQTAKKQYEAALRKLDMPKAISDQKKEDLLSEYRNLMLKKQMNQDSMVLKLFQ